MIQFPKLRSEILIMQNVEDKTLFLDFDGVLFDTVLESYILARYAFSGIDTMVVVNQKEFDFFCSVRFLVINSWHYYYIMKLIKENFSYNIEEFSKKYFQLLQNRDIKNDSKFDKKFQEKRMNLMNSHFDFWNSLNKPYPFLSQIKQIRSYFNIIIVSTKNEETILRHLDDYHFSIDKYNIIGKIYLKQVGSKYNFIKNYMYENKIKNGYFIDDNKDILDSCCNIKNLKTFLANWGYVKDKKMGFSENEIINAVMKG